MPLIHYDNIIVSIDRQRKKLDKKKLEELQDSISSIGLLNAIVVRDTPSDDGKLKLVAGYRRFTAMKQLAAKEISFHYNSEYVAPGYIPIISIETLSEEDAEIAELDENIKRVDLTWEERAAAIAKIHEIRSIQNPEHTRMDTGREIRKEAHTSDHAASIEVSRSILIANNADKIEVSGAKSLREAYQNLLKIEEVDFTNRLLDKQNDKTEHILHHFDVEKNWDALPQGEFDLVIADPPYGIGADAFGDAAKLSHGYVDDAEAAHAAINNLADRLNELCRPKAHLFLFCDVSVFDYAYEMLSSYEWHVWRTPLIWHKPGMGHTPRPDHGPRRSYEMILFAYRNNKMIKQSFQDVLEGIPSVKDKFHAAQKPVDLYKTLINLTCIPGSLILDPYCGSGTIFPAANLTSCRAIGCEIDERMVKIARSRMNGAE